MEAYKKAQEIFNKCLPLAHDWESDNRIIAKKIAIVCVDEIIEATSKHSINEESNSVDIVPIPYWIHVKFEIEKF